MYVTRFFYADENLTAVAAELDSFDGRKDPERCACLVNRLRSCQDKLINICNRMLEELEPGTIKRSREFRAKYPGNLSTLRSLNRNILVYVSCKKIEEDLIKRLLCQYENGSNHKNRMCVLKYL